MKRALSLAWLTTAPLPPPAAIRLASALGCGHVGLRIRPAAPGGPFDALESNRALLIETLAALDETGMQVFDVEIIRIGPDFALANKTAFLEMAARLGAKAVLVAGDDPDEARLTEHFAAFAERAARYRLTADLEFMPWTAVRNARDALRIVEASGADNARVLIDALHVFRSETSLADIAAIPRERLHYVQLCDGPAEPPRDTEGLIQAARQERLLPGQGAFDLAGLLAALPANLAVSIEVPSESQKQRLGTAEWARRAVTATRARL